ncbi:ParA family protein [Nocardia transvalensis]|uniref:ParA family protein n=1 Tax=Nocardia transvalensis TaxID=37333 RepID=UPI00189347DF|nr:AAA family ATPase [Nocardia transvalensis]MBF6333641.1 AAA family ATPase [Nocardia transvalensis]
MDQPVFEIWPGLGHVICFANWKGGVGKTTSTVNLGVGLALEGKRVLIVDINSQGTVAVLLGLLDHPEYDQGAGLFTSITTGAPLNPIKDVRPGLDVLPGGDYITLLDDALSAQLRSATTAPRVVLGLAKALHAIAANYDVVLVDTPPENETLLLIGLGASRFILVPMKTDDLSRHGLSQLVKRVEIARDHNPYLMLLGLFIFDSSTTSRGIRAETRKDIASDLQTDDLMFDAFIRHAEKVAKDSAQYGRVPIELADEVANNPTWTAIRRGEAKDAIVVSPTSIGVAEDYDRLKKEIQARMEARRAELIEEGNWP